VDSAGRPRGTPRVAGLSVFRSQAQRPLWAVAGEAPSTPLTCPHWARQGVRVALFLLFGAQPLRGTTLAPACPMRPASRSRHREPSACSRMSHDLLVSHYASSHLSLL